jgi:putative oxidoreductase
MVMDTGILILRVVFGIAIAAHGSQKLFGWFGGYGIKGTGEFFEGLGFRPGTAFATAAGLGEFGGGSLIAFGLLTPLGAASVLATMLVAIVTVHLKNGFFAMGNGIELPFLYAASAVAVAFTGAGRFSMDGLFGLTLFTEPSVVAGILVLAVIGAWVTLGLRRQVERQASVV